MKDTLQETLTKLDQAIQELNDENHAEGLPRIARARICILGQMSLFVHPDPRTKQLTLFATADVDAVLEGDYQVTVVFRNLLADQGLELDSDGPLVWLPEGATYTEIVKAPKKNRPLIRESLEIFGQELRTLMEENGASCEDFEG